MVFCFKKCHDILWEIAVHRPRIWIFFDIIYSNCGRSEQFLQQGFQVLIIVIIKRPIGTNNWDVETQKNNLENIFFYQFI